MKLKKILCLILSLTLCLGLLTIPSFAQNRVGFSNFKKVNAFRNSTFNDVEKSDWFYYDVKAIYELGIMTGKSENSFSPNDSMTIAEAITLVARLHAIFYGIEDPFDQTWPWYSTYIDYAIRNHYKILNHLNQIDEIDYSLKNYIDYNAKISRACFTVLIYSAFSGEKFVEINHIPDDSILDVRSSDYYYTAVYTLYKVGILNGAGEGYFSPQKDIKRSEVATILNRIIYPINRIDKTNR